MWCGNCVLTICTNSCKQPCKRTALHESSSGTRTPKPLSPSLARSLRSAPLRAARWNWGKSLRICLFRSSLFPNSLSSQPVRGIFKVWSQTPHHVFGCASGQSVWWWWKSMWFVYMQSVRRRMRTVWARGAVSQWGTEQGFVVLRKASRRQVGFQFGNNGARVTPTPRWL